MGNEKSVSSQLCKHVPKSKILIWSVSITVADASASWPWDGMTEGGDENLGSYYSCLEMDSDDADNGAGLSFLGQYCLVQHYITPKGISIGLPGPSDSMTNMSDPEYQGVFKPLLSNLTFSNPIIQVCTESRSRTKTDLKLQDRNSIF